VPFTSIEEQDDIYNTLAKESSKRDLYVATATPQLAQRVGQIHSSYPGLAAGVKLSMAKAGFTDDQIARIYPAASTAVIEQSVKEPKKESWFQRNVTNKAKTASRYGFAAANFPLDFVQGGLAQITDVDDSVSGWFISTDLGSLIANDEQAGSGWFMGDKAKELQAERARRYRGTVGGHAWTIGRGLSSVVFQPDTQAFNIMSGALDAAAALAVPIVPGGKAVKTAILTASEAGKGGAAVRGAASALEAVGRGSTEIKASKIDASEVDDARKGIIVGGSIDYESANKWFGSGQAQRVIDRTATTTDFAGVWDLWGRKIDPELALAMAKESDPDKIRLLLVDKLGQAKGLASTKDFRGGNKIYMSLGRRDKFMQSMPLGDKVSKAYSKMPKRSVNLFQAETTADRINNLNALDSMLKLTEVDAVTRRTFLNRAGNLVVSKNPNAHAKFIDDLDVVMRDATEATGVNREIVDAIFDNYKSLRDDAARFDMDDNFDIADAGLYQRLYGGIDPNAADVSFAGPQLASEFGKHEYFIPDVRQLRRLTGSKINWIYTKQGKIGDPNIDELRKAGQLRLPFAFVASAQENFWRPIITATIGNFTRNTIDSQLMIALSHRPVSSIIRHPFQYLTMLRKETGIADIYGRAFDEAPSANAESAAQEAHKFLTTTALNAHYKDPVMVQRKAKRLGTFTVRDRTIDSVGDVARGHADEIGKLNADWAARTFANGATTQDIVNLIRTGNADAVKWYETMLQYYKDGRQTYNRVTGQWQRQTIDLVDDTNLAAVLDETATRVSRITGNNPALLEVVGQGKLAAQIVDSGKIISGDPRVGSRVIYKVGKRGKAEGEVIGINRATGEVEIRPFAFRQGEATNDLNFLLRSDAVYKDPSMPKRVGGEVIDPRTPMNDQLKKSMDRIIDLWHGKLYNEPIAKLERSPIFKQLYHEWIDKLAVSLDSKSVDDIIADVTANATAAGVKPERYMNEKIWNKLLDIQSGKIKNYGTITREELNAFASGQAIDEVTKMFYNAVERRNFTDSMRIISPFAQQWAEFAGRLGRTAFTPVSGGKLYLPDVSVLRKGQLAVNGATEGDPDGNGRGFVYKDPTSGQWTFTFPLSGQLSKLLTGITAPINAPIKGIAMGLDYRPQLGPFATMAVSAIMPDSPSFDIYRTVLLPFGEKRGITESLAPSWFRKIYDGMTGYEGSAVFMNTYVETMQALASTGDYDTSNPDERDRLMNDAKRKAGYLSILRGISQFTGPAAGNFDQAVKAGEVDVYASELAKAFQEMKNQDYDSAVGTFIEVFGEDAFSYLANKTKSVTGGLEASEEFGVFERNNRGLFRQYKEVAGYFGPIGSDFDFAVYQRQLSEGSRVKLTPEQVLLSAESTIAMSYYRTMRANFPTTLNEQQRQYVAAYRGALQKKYKGYAQMQFDPNKLPRQILQLREAASLSDLDGNQAAEGVRYYMQVRDAALAEANNRGYSSLSSKDTSDLREYLSNYASAITKQYPEFARVYDRLLSQEVEQ